MKEIKKPIRISPFLLVIISFLIVIFLASLILVSPIARNEGTWGTYIDSLFSAVTATCVTGLVSLQNGIAGEFNFIGQLVILICMQIGGLGFMTILAFTITLFRNKLKFKDRLLFSQAVGSNSMSELVIFVRKIILISLTFELIGAIVLLPVFLEVTDIQTSIWYSIFHSISAYNNAGIDLFGTTSLILGNANIISSLPVWAYNYLCITIMFLIVFGGISFLTVIDIFHFRKPSQWRVFTKIVLLVTCVLVFGGAIFFFISEGFKGENSMNILQAFFQSITLRTAGFVTYNQANLSPAGFVVSCLLMFIGGSPLSTAGGVKTTTAFLIILAMFSYFRSRKIVAFKRYYSNNMVIKAMSLVFLGIIIIVVSFLAVAGFESANPVINREEDIIFEVFSAFGTVGVTTGITTSLGIGSKIVLMLLMLVGRIGPITFMQMFQNGINDVKEDGHFHYVEEDFLIG
ncbi:MAG: hypothetical protein LBM03_00925 [Erysipelotrichaceae bacterium]|jgi:trk system potassium uptake protein TrkH|nr:hypothetical protein [Erysipelotrichaceae bacterium]